jgi:hypothetical protein
VSRHLIILLNVRHTKCRFALCCYAECRDAYSSYVKTFVIQNGRHDIQHNDI